MQHLLCPQENVIAGAADQPYALALVIMLHEHDEHSASSMHTWMTMPPLAGEPLGCSVCQALVALAVSVPELTLTSCRLNVCKQPRVAHWRQNKEASR